MTVTLTSMDEALQATELLPVRLPQGFVLVKVSYREHGKSYTSVGAMKAKAVAKYWLPDLRSFKVLDGPDEATVRAGKKAAARLMRR